MSVSGGVPYRFEPTATAAAVEAEHAGLADGEESGVVVTVAGLSLIHI